MFEELLEAVRSLARQSRQLDGQAQLRSEHGPIEPFSDPRLTQASKRTSPDRPHELLFGKIIDAVPHTNWYRVLPEGLSAPMECVLLTSSTACSPLGVRQAHQLQLGDSIWFILPRHGRHGIILGVIPAPELGKNLSLADYISQGSRSGLSVEGCHIHPHNLEELTDWSNGRPLDSTTGGELCWVTESGTMLFLDAAMAFLRADDNCGVWAFYRDQLLRLAGHNLQLRAGGVEMDIFDDEGEHSLTWGSTPYPWEALGAYSSEVQKTQRISPQDQQLDSPWLGGMEPMQNDQQPWYRYREEQGYLGNLSRRSVVLPPTSQPESGLYRSSQERLEAGVFEEHIAATGAFLLRSAKRVSIAKTPPWPAHHRQRDPADPLGSHPGNYKASGKYGAGVEHNLSGEIEVNSAWQRQQVFPDQFAYEHNYESVTGQRLKRFDFHLPEHQDMQNQTGISPAAPSYVELIKNPDLADPTSHALDVDHRYNQAEYSARTAYLNFLDDGGVALGDGWGSEIRLVRGHIEITCPGDARILAGRRIVNLAGWDFLARARKELELTTTSGNIRARSGRHFWQSAEGGILLESRSTAAEFDGCVNKKGDGAQISGITLKAAQAAVVTWADQIYLRSGVPDFAGAERTGRGIVLDSGAGEGRIIVSAYTYERYLNEGAFDYFLLDGSIEVANVYGRSGANMGACLAVRGTITSTEDLIAGGWLLAPAGHVATRLSEAHSGLVDGLPVNSNSSALVTTTGTTAVEMALNGTTAYEEAWPDWVWAATGQGYSLNISSTRLTFRSSGEYGALDLCLYESRWQQTARLTNQNLQVWTELASQAPDGVSTYPFPGREALTVGNQFYRQDLNIFSPLDGPKNRDSASYTQAIAEAAETVKLDAHYTVIP